MSERNNRGHGGSSIMTAIFSLRAVIVSLIISLVSPLLLDVVLHQEIGTNFIVYFIFFFVSIYLGALLSKGIGRSSASYEEDEDDDREEGTVKWFNSSKGFGFLTRDNDEDVFVHYRAIRGRGRRFLIEGQQVRFYVTEGEKGKQAEHVSIVR